jgi:hypothetical protein
MMQISFSRVALPAGWDEKPAGRRPEGEFAAKVLKTWLPICTRRPLARKLQSPVFVLSDVCGSWALTATGKPDSGVKNSFAA